MSIVSKLSGKNQTTIPKAVVQALRIKPSSLLVYEIEADGRVLLTTKSATFEELAGGFPTKKRRKPATESEIQTAVRQGAIRRFKKAGR